MTVAVQKHEQDRDDHGRFGSGDGGTGQGLPRGDTHAQTEGGGKFQHGTPKEAQVTWAHEKAKEQGRSTFMAPNPAHDPAKAGSGGPFKLSYKPPTKGEYHEVKPDGSMVYHPAAAKMPKGAPRGTVLHARDSADADFARALARARPRIAFARAIETAVEGDAPNAARLWRAGWNKTDKGDLNFTPQSAKLVMQAYAERGNPLAWYYEHEDRLPLQERGGAPMKGVCSAPTSDLAIRGETNAPELWAEHIAWTNEARRQIVSGERRQLSPVAAYDEETREIIEILNVSLCAEGATHNGTLLASREGRTGSVDELIQSILEALQANDFETAEDLVQQAEAMAEGGDSMSVKMARAALKSAKPPPPPPVPPDAGAGDVATKRLAASRPGVVAPGVNVAAFDRAVAEMQAATREAQGAARESKRATVQTLIAANRDLFDPADEREHLTLGDPAATQRHIASTVRKIKAGLLVLSKGTEDATVKKNPAAPKDAPAGKSAEDQLTLADKLTIDQYNRGQRDPKKHITAEDFLRSKQQHAPAVPPAAKGAVA